MYIDFDFYYPRIRYRTSSPNFVNSQTLSRNSSVTNIAHVDLDVRCPKVRRQISSSSFVADLFADFRRRLISRVISSFVVAQQFVAEPRRLISSPNFVAELRRRTRHRVSSLTNIICYNLNFCDPKIHRQILSRSLVAKFVTEFRRD